MDAAVPVEGDPWFERKHGGSRRWSDSGDPFRSSSNRRTEEDDEAELTWAALEKLPTHNRLHTAMLGDQAPSAEGGKQLSHVDVRHLAQGQRATLVEKALATSEQDNERLLGKVKERIQRFVLDQLVGSLRVLSPWSV